VQEHIRDFLVGPFEDLTIKRKVKCKGLKVLVGNELMIDHNLYMVKAKDHAVFDWLKALNLVMKDGFTSLFFFFRTGSDPPKVGD
jgi:hypothetical protein